MQNWNTTHTKELKKWFDIESYKKFEDLTLILLFHELWVRTFFFKEQYEDYEEEIVTNNRNSIYNGNPFLVPAERLGYMNPFYRLFQPPHLLLPTTERLAELSIVAMQRGIFLWQGDDEYILNRHFAKKLIGDGMPDLFDRTVMFEVDLASGTDEEIAESLKSVLPQWRKVKHISPDPVEAIRFGYGTIKKIINNRIIPMLDILVWAQEHGVRVSDIVLSRLLYSLDDEDIRSEEHIKDTDRPLAMKAATLDFIRQFHFFINKNSHLKDMKVSDVLKLAARDQS
ncbi:hypothetical protein JP88_003365 [Salmonella enterica subsp. enterica]|nr:hypothetical protein [Salmonella enterica]EBY0806120.1 hypothetical protein [Salmonella enterica subsp. enterica serovar Berlin]EDW0612018.1 hypothetical protein [Salmonella enterica subsp. enterica serovar Ball]EAX6578479.1 hypothetical protein [Salmonella enterica]EBO9651607.1 hypothetical protein [Salmonella enterica]